jgi:probable F420-dependent oxidoreductase
MARLGCRLANAGEVASKVGIAEMARVAESAGADALHLADHIVLPEQNESRYPFSEDGKYHTPAITDFYEVLTSCAWIAAQTTSIDVGPSVLVLPQRNPLLVAKVAASISRLSKGRLFLGVGAGWLREEFNALGHDFDKRGRALDEGLQILSIAWEGKLGAFSGTVWQVPEGIHCRPAPDDLPVLIGGMSNVALRRAAAYDGWIAHVGAQDDLGELREKLDKLRGLRAESGSSRPFRSVVKVAGYNSVEQSPQLLTELVSMGFDEVVVYPEWTELGSAARFIATCRTMIDKAH